MSHPMKLFLKIIHRRSTKLVNKISATQFDLNKEWGQKKHYSLMQRCLDVNRNIFACFIDFTKAFENVQYDKLINILKQKVFTIII